MSTQDNGKNLRRLAVGTTIAAAAGYVAGVLTAPKSGKQTRGDIKAAAVKKRQEAEKQLKKLHTDLDKIIKEAKSRSSKMNAKAQKEIADLLKKAKASKESTKQAISAVHEGDAEDDDLRKAITNAQNSIDNLRTYLKKKI
jgi:gas vesicle protein